MGSLSGTGVLSHWYSWKFHSVLLKSRLKLKRTYTKSESLTFNFIVQVMVESSRGSPFFTGLEQFWM